LCASKRSATGDAGAFTKWIGGFTVLANDTLQTLGEFVRCAQSRRSVVYCSPHLFLQLHVFDILCEIIQPSQQTKRISEGRNGGLPEACRHAQPSLLADLDHDPIFNALDRNGQRGLPAGLCSHARDDLDCQIVGLSNCLGTQVAPIEFSHQGLDNVIWFDVPVQDSSFHVFDYNPFTSGDDLSSYFMYIYVYVYEADLV
jgi:hypothetical protein